MAEFATDRTGTAGPSANVPPTMEEEDSIDLVDVFQTLASGKRVILGTSLIALALATAVAFFLTTLYTSDVSFIPPNPSGGNSMASALAGQFSVLSASDILGGMKNSGDLYAEILRSRSIASELVKRFDLMHVYKVKKESQAEKVLAANTAIAVDLKSGVITVSVTNPDPSTAQQLANAYMDALRETDERLALSQSSQRRLFFREQLAKEKDSLEEAEVDLKRTEEQSGLIAPTGQTEGEIKTIEETRSQIAAREVQLAALRQSATEQNPELIRLQSEITDLQGQLSRLQRGGGNESNAAIPTSKVPELQLEYVRKDREVKYHEELFEMLSKQYEAARLDEAHDAAVPQVLDPASYPDTKSSPRRLLIMLGGLVLGFMSGCVWVLLRGPLRTFHADSLSRSKTA